MSDKKKAEKKLNFMQKSSIKFVDRDPLFLQKLKASVGYQEPVLADKFSEPTAESRESSNELDEIRKLKEEERPQIVVLNPALDLTQQEFQREIEQQQLEEDKKKIDHRQITFKKPIIKEDKEVSAAKKTRVDSSEVKRLDNTKLLSFIEENEE